MRLLTCAVYVALVLLAWTAVLAAAESLPGAAIYGYKGRQVSAAWIDQQYAYFKDKIACVDGKFYDIGRDLAQIEVARRYPEEGIGCVVTTTPPVVGHACLSCFTPTGTHPNRIPEGAKVLQVLGKDEAIIAHGTILFRVGSIDTTRYIDGTRFYAVLLVYTGTYRYISVAGAARTIQSFVIYQPISREQFITALSNGFELVRYKRVTKKVPEMRGGSAGDGFRVTPSVKVMVDKTEIVGQPVPPPAGAPPVKSTPPGEQAPRSGVE